MTAWQHIVQSLTPEYNTLLEILNNGPTYVCNIKKTGRSFTLTLEVKDMLYEEKSVSFDDRIKWITEQLSTWPNVRRSSYDKWVFKLHRDARKFITLYNIKWAK